MNSSLMQLFAAQRQRDDFLAVRTSGAVDLIARRRRRGRPQLCYRPRCQTGLFVIERVKRTEASDCLRKVIVGNSPPRSDPAAERRPRARGYALETRICDD